MPTILVHFSVSFFLNSSPIYSISSLHALVQILFLVIWSLDCEVVPTHPLIEQLLFRLIPILMLFCIVIIWYPIWQNISIFYILTPLILFSGLRLISTFNDCIKPDISLTLTLCIESFRYCNPPLLSIPLHFYLNVLIFVFLHS